MKISIGNHPLGFVYDLADKYGDDLTLTFSKYFYRPGSVFDERVTFEVPISEVSPDWVIQQCLSLDMGWDLALNSKVKDQRGRTLHIGMIDFVGSPDKNLIRTRVNELIATKSARDIDLYNSGRSYHGYILDLMYPSKWREFLGRLLLMNNAKDDALVDTRWIGHRLVGGYTALRWSSNSGHYLQLPCKID